MTHSEHTVSFREVFGFVWRYWCRVPWKFGTVIAGGLLGVLIEVQIPIISATLVVAVQNYAQSLSTLDAAYDALLLLLAAFAGLSLVQQVYLRVWIRLAAQVMQNLIYDGFHRVQRFSSDWHADHFAGSTVRQITRGMWAYDSLADTVVTDMGPGLLLLIGVSISMFLREPLMGLYFAGAVIIFIGVSVAMSLYYVAPANVLSNDADTALGGQLADAVTCNSVIKSFGAEQREDEAMYASSGNWRIRARTAWLMSMDAGAVQSVMIIALLGGLLMIVLSLAEQGSPILDDIVYVITSYFIVNGYLRNIGWQVRNLQKAINELDDLVRISKTWPQVRDNPEAITFTPGTGAIRYHDISFRYPNQPTAIFEHFNLTIEAGEKVALVGESGSGKSTFVKLLQRLYDVDEGVIEVDGHDIRLVTQQSLRQAISLVPQEPILFHRTLAENIAYGKPGASMAEIVHAARVAHASEFIEQLSLGYDTLVGERGIKLSGGERQRVAIARAVLADAPVLVLDEATSSLDSMTEHYIQDAMAKLMEGRTSIIVAHRLSTIRQVDRILVFDHGRIVEQGDHERLMDNDQGTYRRLYDMQALGFIDDVAKAPRLTPTVRPGPS
ncbi:MAG: ABC transporter ATP-binding protein [Proteobacteria bacterium]|nr:ABC transporter ATP-binding protein [Pseudomonadota bacterium]